MIDFPAPMQATEELRAPFTAADWLYEIKFDGYRCIAGIEAGQVLLRTKQGTDCTGWYPEVVDALAKLHGGPHVIDGEACVLDQYGVSDFNKLQARARRRRRRAEDDQVTLCVFDLLMLNGQSLIDLALTERKRQLSLLLAPVPKQAVLFVGDLPADVALFKAMVASGLKIEGVMAKRKDAPYQPGVRSPDWLKIKRAGWQDGRNWKG